MRHGRALAPGEVVSLRHARGLEVSVASGRLWITEESRPEDIWLGAGECARLHGDGLALIEAVDASCVRFEQH